RNITTIVLDKTGTVTEGRMILTDVVTLNGASRTDVLRLAGAVEAASEHPVAQAVASAARAELGSLPPVERFRTEPWLGAEGIVAGGAVLVGRGGGNVRVRVDGDDVARRVVTDTVKPTSREAVADLRRLGLVPVLLTGDGREAAERVGREVGIDRVVAEV